MIFKVSSNPNYFVIIKPNQSADLWLLKGLLASVAPPLSSSSAISNSSWQCFVVMFEEHKYFLAYFSLDYMEFKN